MTQWSSTTITWTHHRSSSWLECIVWSTNIAVDLFPLCAVQRLLPMLRSSSSIIRSARLFPSSHAVEPEAKAKTPTSKKCNCFTAWKIHDLVDFPLPHCNPEQRESRHTSAVADDGNIAREMERENVCATLGVTLENDFFTCLWLQSRRINIIQSDASFSARQSSKSFTEALQGI